jgi:phosphatidylglycerol:prolipoprotein diacylglycerol transferase
MLESLRFVSLLQAVMGGKISGEKTLFLPMLADATAYVNFHDLGLRRQFDIGPLPIRFYSLAYIIGIFAAFWLIKRMLRQPGAPMAERHVDDLLFYAMLGVIGGGRLGYVLAYNLPYFLQHPVEILKLWDGGMSFHGGVAGVMLAIFWVARRSDPRLSFLRICDYIACVMPIGMLLGRLANFVNGELWGRVTDVPWAIIFCDMPARVVGECVSSGLPRHPSQLYQAGLEGLLMLIVLSYAFWRTDARYYPGRLWGMCCVGLGLSRFIVEFVREPDSQLSEFARVTHLSMGQWLTIPFIVLGLWLIWTSGNRRQRIEPFAGTSSVA